MDWLYSLIATPAVRYAAGVVVSWLALKAVARRLLKKALYTQSESMPENYKQDMVYLHTFPRKVTKGVVNLSPFGIKVETWLRLHKIPYELVQTMRFSKSTHQMPYMVMNGEEYVDSNLMIEPLSRRYDIDATEGLSPEQRGASRAFIKLLDEHTSWTYFLPRYTFQPEKFVPFFRLAHPWPLYGLIPKAIKKGCMRRAKSHGIGLKSPDVIAQMGKDDVIAISLYLGDKRFMMGDTITTVDCAVFGHLSQIVYVDFPYEHKDVLKNECTNIEPYMERIRTELWPEWDSIVAKGTFC